MDQERPAREACGVFGVWDDPEAVAKTYYGIFALQHRGQESAGIASTDGRVIQRHRGMGTVGAIFADEQVLARLAGRGAIGHVRYSTMGASLLQNAQPLVANTQWGTFAVAHNGNFTNGPSLRARFEAAGAIFQTTTDSEVFLHLLARAGGSDDPAERIAAACREVRGAYSLLVMTPGMLVGARDPQGFRPLWLGQTADGKYAFSSETPSFDLTRIRPLYEVPAGTLVVVDAAGVRQVRFAEPRPAHCVFEHVYFSRPDGVIFGDAVQEVRKALGRQLAREHPAPSADIVIAIPDSGNAAAMGYSLESGIPLEQGFIRNHYVGRTFIQPSAASRALSADLKLNVVRSAVEGKRVLVVDDSVVRGTTARRRCHYLREAGAREVHLRVSCPPIKSPCFYGVDFQSKGELMAAVHTIDEMARIMEVDSLGFLSVEGMLSVLSSPASDYCTACWTGNYSVPIEEGMSKKSCGEGPSVV
ncbi:MAG: amidophosphoribosyltransferase [Planctomycetota bacterium]|nr:amidophosphoribosyltransferase [Planctomycetota bacterium]